MAELAKHLDLDHLLEILKKEKVVDPKADWKTISFYKPKKSSASEDGYSGRIGIHEILKVTPTIKALVMKSATSDDVDAQARKEGMMSMLEDGIFKAIQGLTTIEEVLRVVSE